MASSGELLRDLFMSLFCSIRGYLVSDRTPGFVPWSWHLDVKHLGFGGGRVRGFSDLFLGLLEDKKV